MRLRRRKLYAADLDSSLFASPPQPAPTQPVEFGTGWYIRGDVAYARDSLPNINNFGFFPDTSAFRNTYSLGLGGGYKFTNWFRTDVTIDYREPVNATDTNTSTYANGTRWDSLANGYVDLGNWSGFTPYVGAGVGAAWGYSKIYTKDSALSCTQGGTVMCFAKNMPLSLAWSLMAGFAFEIYPHTFIDVGYRYLNLGSYSFYDNSILSQVVPPAGMTSAVQSHVHEIRFGLRYMID